MNFSQDSILGVQRAEVCFWALILDIWKFRLLLFNLSVSQLWASSIQFSVFEDRFWVYGSRFPGLGVSFEQQDAGVVNLVIVFRPDRSQF